MISDATFTTVITVWPDVNYKSTAADICRAISYILWWAFMTRVFATYSMMLSLMVALEHQFKNLMSYFCNLALIFEEDLSQEQKELKYEEGVKIGFKLHSDTIAYVNKTVDVGDTGRQPL